MQRFVGDNRVVKVKINACRVVDFCPKRQVFFLFDAVLHEAVRLRFIAERIDQTNVVKREFNNAFAINFGRISVATCAKFDARNVQFVRNRIAYGDRKRRVDRKSVV